MKLHHALNWIVPLIFVLAAFAAGAGLFYQTPGSPYTTTSFRGEQITINGRGLYFYDTVSSAAQMQANDLIALLLGLPLLAVSFWLARKTADPRRSLQGGLLLAGTIGFFLYTYMSMCFNTAFNALFLVYVVLFSLSLYGFILALLSIDLRSLPARFTSRLPRGWIAGLLIAAGVFLLLAWTGRVSGALLNPPAALENGTSMVIQAMDLGLIVPLAFLAGILLLRRNAWGYLLSSVAVLKMLTMGTAVSAMGINMLLAGVPDSPFILIPFITLTLVNFVLAVLLLRDVH